VKKKKETIMPRKNVMRDNVSAVRSRLPHLSNLSREKIELALLYYESNVDETVEAFKTSKLFRLENIHRISFFLDGAVEALSGWTEMSNGRGNVKFLYSIKKLELSSFRLRLNEQIINLVINHHKYLRPMGFYDHHNVFQISFKRSLKVVHQ
jgi:hypothetical protein